MQKIIQSEIDEALEDATEPIQRLLQASDLYPILIIAQLFLLVTGEYLFSINRWATITYIILPLGVMYSLGMEFQELNKLTYIKDPLSKALPGNFKRDSLAVQALYYLGSFWMFYGIFLTAAWAGYLGHGQVDALEARSLMAFNFVLVAPSETIVFHGVLPLWLRKHFQGLKWAVPAEYGLSQIIFAGFHIAVYGWEPTALFSAFVMGCIFLYISKNYGLAPTMGAHSAYNLVVLGIGTVPLIGG
jgi:hypothetical protein